MGGRAGSLLEEKTEREKKKDTLGPGTGEEVLGHYPACRREKISIN